LELERRLDFDLLLVFFSEDMELDFWSCTTAPVDAIPSTDSLSAVDAEPRLRELPRLERLLLRPRLLRLPGDLGMGDDSSSEALTLRNEIRRPFPGVVGAVPTASAIA